MMSIYEKDGLRPVLIHIRCLSAAYQLQTSEINCPTFNGPQSRTSRT